MVVKLWRPVLLPSICRGSNARIRNIVSPGVCAAEEIIEWFSTARLVCPIHVDQIPATFLNCDGHDEVRIDLQVFAHIAENSEQLRLENTRLTNIVYWWAQAIWVPEHNGRVYCVA